MRYRIAYPTRRRHPLAHRRKPARLETQLKQLGIAESPAQRPVLAPVDRWALRAYRNEFGVVTLTGQIVPMY